MSSRFGTSPTGSPDDLMICERLAFHSVARMWRVAIVVGLLLAGLVWVSSASTDADASAEQCVRPTGLQRIVFSARKYPNVRRHFRGALRRGWPRRLIVNRRGADARRERALRDVPIRDGFDRDEYPPAVGRGRGPRLERGRNPRGWEADVRYVPSCENRSHGASLGNQLEPFCNGTRFRYVFR